MRSYLDNKSYLKSPTPNFAWEESSEIAVVQTILASLNLKGVVFSCDALHCQKKLYQQVQLTTEQTQPNSVDISEDKCRNRVVCRTVSVFNNLLGISSQWEGIKSLIKVERQGKRAGVDDHQTAYYISSLELSAAEFAVGIQGHWGIENRLHWVKDVVFGEDKSLIRHSIAAANFSVIRQLALAEQVRQLYRYMSPSWLFIPNYCNSYYCSRFGADFSASINLVLHLE
ncbi:MAG: ISAs1 family transposase [Okeania sp. SIO2D1]|nr:ISAs1 family transposase [Okeania sp. SIO2D1]